MVQRHLVVAGEQRKYSLVENQDGEKDQDTWCACVCGGGQIGVGVGGGLTEKVADGEHCSTCFSMNRTVACHMHAISPDRMKQKEAGLRKKGTPLLRDMVMQMEPMAIMVTLRRASTAAVRFRSTGSKHSQLAQR